MNKAEAQFHKKASEYLSFEKSIFDRARQIAWFPGGNYEPLPEDFENHKLNFSFTPLDSVNFVTVTFLGDSEGPMEVNVDVLFQELSMNKEDWDQYVLFYKEKCEKNIQRIVNEGKK